MHTIGNIEQIAVDKTIAGVVIADDESGQFYKTIVIQDSTGGISVKLDGYDLYTKYPVGRQVFIKLKGLYMAITTGSLKLAEVLTIPEAGRRLQV